MTSLDRRHILLLLGALERLAALADPPAAPHVAQLARRLRVPRFRPGGRRGEA